MKLYTYMMKIVYLMVSTSVLFLTSSCANRNTRGIVYPVEKAIVTSFSEDISKIVSIVEIKPIDDTIIFSSVSKMVLDEYGNYYILDSRRKILSINPDGGIGPLRLTRGRALNEYISALDICYMEGKISILEDHAIKVFDITDINKHFQIDLREIKDPVDAISVVPGDRFYLFSAFSTSARNDKKGYGNTLRFISCKGRILAEAIPREDCTFSMNNISQSRENTYYLRPQNSQSVFYKLEQDSVSPAFRIDFGEKRMPSRYYYNVADEDIGEYMMSDYYKLPMDYHDTKDYVYCRFCGPQASECSLVYSRKTRKCIAWENTNSDVDHRIVGSDNDNFIIVPTCSDGDYGPLGQIIQSMLKEKCSDGQRAIVKIRFSF